MNKLRNTILVLSLFCSFTPATVSCTTERNPCLELTVSKLNVGCYQYKTDTKTYIDTALPNANFVSIDIDSAKFLYWGVVKLSKYAIILSPLRDTIRWTLQVDSGFSKLDTLSFIYHKNLKFYSNGCGYGYTYTLAGLLNTKNNLDSAKISDINVTTKAGIENVKIYF